METACLRIKFSPLIQDTLKSQYCLEIIPQVSCVKNLDKLVWKQETNFIEYKIPMTYRVILKRLHEENEDTLTKTYHSCVDLLKSSSNSGFDVASDDISRMLSDTFIFNKTNTSPMSKENVMNLTNLSENRPVLSQDYKITTNNTGLKVLQLIDKATETVKKDVLQLESKLSVVNVLEKTLCDKIINTETTGLILYAKRSDPKRKLSASPICSVNTQDNAAAVAKPVTRNVTAYKMYESLKELVPIPSISADTLDVQISNSSERTSRPNSIKSVHFTSSSRPPPEIRIAQFMQYISKELLPLNLSLNQLMCKCALLGLSQPSLKNLVPVPSKMFLFKSVHKCIDEVKTGASETIVSNRAVFTVVYDG